MLTSVDDGSKHAFEILTNLDSSDPQGVNALGASPAVAPLISRWICPAIMREAIDFNGQRGLATVKIEDEWLH